eukprot:tig00000241_g21048.t1
MWNITQHPYNKNLTGKKKTKPKPAAASSPEPKPTALSLAEDGSVEVKHTDKQAAPSPIEDKPEKWAVVLELQGNKLLAERWYVLVSPDDLADDEHVLTRK